uniref:TolC family outer membrane protein n=1 Tax=Altererythrobacter segetis TaxID=1104773 RepID=UPI00140A16EC|nr:TolC family outer membrane protein [Altererythrobacter segetis]
MELLTMLLRGLRISLLAGACLTATAPAAADTLKDALNGAYRTNPTLEAARAQQRATDENVPIQRAAGLPSLSANGTYTEYLKQSSGNSFVSPERSATGQVSLTVPIYQGGAVRNGIHGAETRDLAGRASLRGSESSLFSQVTAAYMDVILQEAVVGLNTNNVNVLTVNLESTRDQFEIGSLTRTDVAQSEARLALAQGDLRTAQSNLISARERYIQLVGKAPENLAPPPPLPGLPGSVTEAVTVATKNNPDLIAAQENADAAGFDTAAAGAARLPRVNLFVNGNGTDYLGSAGSSLIPGAVKNFTTTAQAGAQITIPLYQGGKPAAQERQAQSRESQAIEQVVATERSVVQQVRAAYAAWQASNEIIASTQTAVAAAELSLEGTRAEQTVGTRQILDILNAEQELLQAQVQLVTARRNAYVAGFSLLAAMGRAEARDLGLEDQGPLYDPVVNYDRVKNNVWDWSHDKDPVTHSTRTVDIPPQDATIPAQEQPAGSSNAAAG